MDDYGGDIVGEGPCEFCGQLFPLILLIEHETIHLAEENYQIFEDVPVSAVTEKPEDKEPIKVEKVKLVENEPQKTEKKEQLAFESELKIACKERLISEPKTIVEKNQMQSSPIKNEKKGDKNQNEKIKELTTGSGEKLLFYGSDIDPDRDLENDKQLYNMPNNPFLSNREKDVEDINNLSDDDCSESLEEFWKRARDALKRNRVKAEC